MYTHSQSHTHIHLCSHTGPPTPLSWSGLIPVHVCKFSEKKFFWPSYHSHRHLHSDLRGLTYSGIFPRQSTEAIILQFANRKFYLRKIEIPGNSIHILLITLSKAEFHLWGVCLKRVALDCDAQTSEWCAAQYFVLRGLFCIFTFKLENDMKQLKRLCCNPLSHKKENDRKLLCS